MPSTTASLPLALPQTDRWLAWSATISDRRRSLIGDDLWSASLNLTSSIASPNNHSTVPATSLPSAASTEKRSELPLKAAHQICLMADRRPLLLPNRHYQGRQELYWHNCAPDKAESMVSMWTELTRLRATIVTTACNHCHDSGQSPHDNHNIFDCPSKPTTLAVESLWTAPTETAKHLNLAIDVTN